jgi:hypothetical protein
MKVYSGIDGIEYNVPTGSDMDAWEAYDEEYVAKIKAAAFKQGRGKYRGKEVTFPVADGRARYVVLSNKELIHLPVGDAWNYRYIEHIPFSEIKLEIERQERIAELFK